MKMILFYAFSNFSIHRIVTSIDTDSLIFIIYSRNGYQSSYGYCWIYYIFCWNTFATGTNSFVLALQWNVWIIRGWWYRNNRLYWSNRSNRSNWIYWIYWIYWSYRSNWIYWSYRSNWIYRVNRRYWSNWIYRDNWVNWLNRTHRKYRTHRTYRTYRK
jgi:hypothetical protein